LLTNKVFQSLIGTIKTLYEVHDFTSCLPFQSLIRTIKTNHEHTKRNCSEDVSIPYRDDKNGFSLSFFIAYHVGFNPL